MAPGLFRASLAVLLVLAATARLREALVTPLVFDEIYGVLLSRSGLASLLHTLSLDVEQPLHFVLMWAWHALGGDAALWLKTLPMLFGVTTIAVVALAGRQMFGAAAGLLAAALLAFHPTHVDYSQQGTFHAMLWCLLTVEVWLAWRWMQQPRRATAIAFVLVGAAALYTAWFASFVLTAIALWGVAMTWREPARLRDWLLLHAGVLALFMPQLPTLVAQIRRDIAGEAHLDPLAFATVQEALRKLAFNMSYLVLPLLALGGVLLPWSATRAQAALLWTVALFTTLLPYALSQAGSHLFILRQMMVNTPLVCLVTAAGVWVLAELGAQSARRAGGVAAWPRWAGVAVAMLLVALAVRSWWLSKPFEEAVRLREAATLLADQAEPGELVVCPEPRALLFVRHYLRELDARLIIMPESETFHHSDGILIVPEAWKMNPSDFARARARGERWWGIRSQHAGRDGPEAAALLTGAAGGDSVTFGRVVVWASPQPAAQATTEPDGSLAGR